MATIDLTAKLEAAAAEATGEDHTLVLPWCTLTVPARMDALGLANACKFEGLAQTARIVEVLVGPEQYKTLLDLHLNDEQLGIVLDAIAGLYGLSLGESKASGSSSANGSRSSRRTSRGSTAST